MNLHDHLTETLDRIDADGPDLISLTAASRTHGARLRRRRRAGGAVVTAVAVLGLAGGVVALAPDGGSSLPAAAVDRSPAAAEPVVDPDPDGPLVPATAPGTIVALRWAVLQQRDGDATSPAGEHHPNGDQHASLRWSDADASGTSTVELSVQHGVSPTCAQMQVECERVALPDGSRLLTYELRSETPDGTVVERVADLRRADGTRVVALATNGLDKGETWDVTRPSPPLSYADLAAVVRHDFWGPRLPAAFVDAGRSLTYASAVPGGWAKPEGRGTMAP